MLDIPIYSGNFFKFLSSNQVACAVQLSVARSGEMPFSPLSLLLNTPNVYMRIYPLPLILNTPSMLVHTTVVVFNVREGAGALNLRGLVEHRRVEVLGWQPVTVCSQQPRV